MMPPPACTDACNSKSYGGRSGNDYGGGSSGRCDDGGLGSNSSLCPLGSDTADCGCREGSTVADWLPPPAELGWGDRWYQCAEGGMGTWLCAFFALIKIPPPHPESLPGPGSPPTR